MRVIIGPYLGMSFCNIISISYKDLFINNGKFPINGNEKGPGGSFFLVLEFEKNKNKKLNRKMRVIRKMMNQESIIWGYVTKKKELVLIYSQF